MTPPRPVVIDTNIVLDLWVFQNPQTQPLRRALQHHTLRWIATPAMREELARVLGYPQIVRRLLNSGVSAALVLAGFDEFTHIMLTAAKAPVTCRDPDDQKFIDLAVAHQSLLLSKDRAVLCMRKRLLALAVETRAALA